LSITSSKLNIYTLSNVLTDAYLPRETSKPHVKAELAKNKESKSNWQRRLNLPKMKFLHALTVYVAVIVLVILSSSSTFLPTAQRSQRRYRSTQAPESDTSGAENDYASRAVIGRVNASGHAAINPRAREIIINQNGRERKDTLGGYADLNMLDQGTIPTVNCSASCTPREALKRMRVETIKLDILKKLRISSLPNMTNQRVPDIPWVRNIIDRNSQQNDSPFSEVAGRDLDFDFDSEHSTTLRTIIFPPTDESSSSSSVDHHSQFCRFTLQPKVFSRKEIVNATFGVYVKRTGSEVITHPVLPAFVFLHKVKANGKTEVYLKKRIPTWSAEEGHWFQFDIKFVVQEWLARPDTNLGLKIVTSDSQGRFKAVVNPNNPDYELHKPFLDVSVRDRARSRSRRSATAMTCEERSNERRCCRYPLIIDFEAFRWDWIIAPRSYHAYYCSGECPFTYFQSFPHTHVVQQVRADSRNGGPCCSPRDLSPISLLYFDTNKNIISGVLPGMVVNRCSCS